MDELVSIIIPLYNCESFIQQSIESCINQTYTNIEVIIINDGSTDNSYNIVQQFLKLNNEYNNIYLISIPHKGKVEAINEGIKHCHGEYIALHAADDICILNRFEREVSILKNSDYNFVYGDCLVVDANLNIISKTLLTNLNYRINYFHALLYKNLIPGGTILFSRELVKYIFPIPSSLLFEDWWIAFCASFYGKIYRVYGPVIQYRQHMNNDNSSLGIKSIYLKINKIKKDYLRHFNYYDEFYKFILNNINDESTKNKYIQIIKYNVLKRKLILCNNLKERLQTYSDSKLCNKFFFALIITTLLGDKILYIKCKIRDIIKLFI